MFPRIRLADESDAAQIQAIYAPIVLETSTSFETEVPTVDEMRQRIHEKLITLPWVVCENHQQILGYVYASKHRERAAYQWSVDTTIYIRADQRRLGLGRALYTSLFRILNLQGFYNAYAGIALPNPASVGLHTALGFEPIGVYRKVGYKFGQWHDVGWWGLRLRPLNESPTKPEEFQAIQNSAEWNNALVAGLPLLRIQESPKR